MASSLFDYYQVLLELRSTFPAPLIIIGVDRAKWKYLTAQASVVRPCRSMDGGDCGPFSQQDVLAWNNGVRYW